VRQLPHLLFRYTRTADVTAILDFCRIASNVLIQMPCSLLSTVRLNDSGRLRACLARILPRRNDFRCKLRYAYGGAPQGPTFLRAATQQLRGASSFAASLRQFAAARPRAIACTEFGPQGVQCRPVVLDGLIDEPQPIIYLDRHPPA